MYYLKYRPQTVGEIDVTRIREGLGESLLSNNFSHAYLLIGTRGVGKTSTARIIAKVVNCQKRKKGEEACNECSSCKAIAEGRSLDTIEIDAASNTGVDDIRELRERVKLAPVEGKYKVYIIDEVHMLSTSAFNALLKTLEEPPPHVIFVLATTDVQKLPETIISRCLVYDFGQPTVGEIKESLKKVVAGEKLEVEEGVIDLIALKARGSMRDATKFLEQLAQVSASITLEHTDKLFSMSANESARVILEQIVRKKTKGAIEAVNSYANEGGKVGELVNSLILLLRDNLLIQKGVIDGKGEIKLSEIETRRLLELLMDSVRNFRESPVPQLPLEIAIVSFVGEERASGGQKKEEGEEVKTEKGLPKDETVEKKPKDGTKVLIKEEKGEKVEEAELQPAKVGVEEVSGKWEEVLTKTKRLNHGLVALLRASRPKELSGNDLTLEVFYKFHKDRLSEDKNRRILEEVVSDIMGRKIKIKFELGNKHS